MYIPKINQVTDPHETVAFMQRYSFATIVTSHQDFPIATHLPFVVEMRGDKIILTSHFAKANAHWNDVLTASVLVIFSEPHAYISPRHYEKKANVPTWNYIAVHAYGTGRLIREEFAKETSLMKMIQASEPAYQQQWDSLPGDYKARMLAGIVPFEIEVTDLQAKYKLGQNRSLGEQETIYHSLKGSTSTTENELSEYMNVSGNTGSSLG